MKSRRALSAANKYKSSAVGEMSDRLATTDMGRKLLAVPLLGELGPHLTQRGLVDAYLHTKRHPNPSNRLATIHQRHGQNWTGQTGLTTVRQHGANRFTMMGRIR